jgi:hypothetical protein
MHETGLADNPVFAEISGGALSRIASDFTT